jgi:Type II secretion system (T2SS), protein E, N-terminal domain
MKEIANSLQGSAIPRLHSVRRVPRRYRGILPVVVMKQYQCAVVGAAQGVLTVAVTNAQDTAVLEALRKLTGRSIFPVLIDASSMRLLIYRLEHFETRTAVASRACYQAAWATEKLLAPTYFATRFRPLHVPRSCREP